jgi:DNA-binding transcriptional ArsR family regulator
MLEEVLGSKPRVRILKVIAQLGVLNVSEIARRVGLNYVVTNKHLKLLEEEGIIQQKTYGRIRMYKFNENSLKAKAVRDLIDIWERTGTQ